MDTLASKCYFAKLAAGLQTEILSHLKVDIFKSGKDKWATPKLWDPIDYYGTAITFEGRRVKLRRPQKPFNHRKVLGAISKGFFDNVTRIDIEYHAKDIKSFREFVNRLSKFQPTALRILNIRSFELVAHEAVWMKPEDRGEIRFPKGLDYISYHPKSCVARFRALDLLKASFDTLTTLEIPAWHSLRHKHIPGLVCPTLRVLRLERDPLDLPVAETFSKFFPNVEELFLLEVQMPNANHLGTRGRPYGTLCVTSSFETMKVLFGGLKPPTIFIVSTRLRMERHEKASQSSNGGL
ncbi:hypothetical protein TWF128_010173 [Orbilia oligospora]|nr:hypothetical protein TWF128_010173 [Orbilia oligospora]